MTITRSALIVIGALILASAGACSLSKSTRQSAQAASSPTATPSTPASTESSTADSHSTEVPAGATEVKDELHTPEKGSTERQAIMDALRGNQDVIFQVNYLKVHNGWTWADVTPLDKSGRATAEGGANLLHFENARWKVMNLSKVPEDPDDPMGPEDPSPTYINHVMKTFPGVPRDIFPKPSN
jgi:hypothetical protein